MTSNYGPLHGFELSIEPNTETTKPIYLGNWLLAEKRFRVFSKRSEFIAMGRIWVLDVVVDVQEKLLTKDKAQPHICLRGKKQLLCLRRRKMIPQPMCYQLTEINILVTR